MLYSILNSMETRHTLMHINDSCLNTVTDWSALLTGLLLTRLSKQLLNSWSVHLSVMLDTSSSALNCVEVNSMLIDSISMNMLSSTFSVSPYFDLGRETK